MSTSRFCDRCGEPTGKNDSKLIFSAKAMIAEAEWEVIIDVRWAAPEKGRPDICRQCLSNECQRLFWPTLENAKNLEEKRSQYRHEVEQGG
jgi:hypothetical protein